MAFFLQYGGLIDFNSVYTPVVLLLIGYT